MNASSATPRSVVPVAVPANADAAELARFSALAHHWWDPSCNLFGPLHKLNPLRLEWLERLAGSFAGKRVLDVGCGGGILSEAMAQRGAQVLGIDLAERALGVSRLTIAWCRWKRWPKKGRANSILSPAWKCSSTCRIPARSSKLAPGW